MLYITQKRTKCKKDQIRHEAINRKYLVRKNLFKKIFGLFNTHARITISNTNYLPSYK
jgi:hypothetical protein